MGDDIELASLELVIGSSVTVEELRRIIEWLEESPPNYRRSRYVLKLRLVGEA